VSIVFSLFMHVQGRKEVLCGQIAVSFPFADVGGKTQVGRRISFFLFYCALGEQKTNKGSLGKLFFIFSDGVKGERVVKKERRAQPLCHCGLPEKKQRRARKREAFSYLCLCWGEKGRGRSLTRGGGGGIVFAFGSDRRKGKKNEYLRGGRRGGGRDL